MDQQTLDRLLNTLEANAKSNTELATSVTGIVGEVRTLGEKVEANTAAVTKLCIAQEAEDVRKAKVSNMVWGVVKHPSTIILMAVALWFAAQLGVAVPATVEKGGAVAQEEGE